MEKLRIPFSIQIPSFDETTVLFADDPVAYVCQIAKEKAQSTSSIKKGVVIGADTMVFFQGKPYGKPKSREDAQNMLLSLAGKWHEVYTGVCVVSDQKVLIDFAMTKVKLSVLSSSQLSAYLDLGSYQDKAGSYAIQDLGSLLVEELEGSYDNVVGLPLKTLNELLIQINIDLWNLVT